MRRWDTEAGAYVDVKSVRQRRADSVTVDAKSVKVWDDGAWREVWPKRLYLYNRGDECNGITGGWTTRGFTWSSSAFKATNPVLVKNSDNLYFYLLYNDWKSGGVSTVNKIDLTKYSKIKILNQSYCANRSSFSDWCGLVLLDNFSSVVNSHYWPPLCIKGSNTRAEKVTEINISGVSGAKYIVFAMVPDSGGTSAAGTVQTWVKQIWLEL